jgi:hypothetical protein
VAAKGGRRLVVGACALTLPVLAVVGGTLDRAEPTGSYRPTLPPAALSTGCRPLPGDAALDFPHVVRSDDDVPADGGAAAHRRLTLHYLEVDADAVRAALAATFPAGSVRAQVTPYDVAPGTVVRGEVRLRLPALSPAETGSGPACDQPYATKQFPPDWEAWPP